MFALCILIQTFFQIKAQASSLFDTEIVRRFHSDPLHIQIQAELQRSKPHKISSQDLGLDQIVLVLAFVPNLHIAPTLRNPYYHDGSAWRAINKQQRTLQQKRMAGLKNSHRLLVLRLTPSLIADPIRYLNRAETGCRGRRNLIWFLFFLFFPPENDERRTTLYICNPDAGKLPLRLAEVRVEGGWRERIFLADYMARHSTTR
ncbi:hypothetical protein F5B18DRAFT_529016 [Nemania serpens]|nr:hypothetical protein F5B18DRAFT_529016 [Nemania serpens]